MIGCLHWGNWCLYNWPCLHWRFSDILGLPSPFPALMEALEPKGNSTDQGEIPPSPPPILQGWVWRAKASNLTPKASRIWALTSCEVTSKATNRDAVQRTTWMIDILHNTVYKDQAHLLHLWKKRWSFHLWHKIPSWSDSCTHPYTSMNSEASLGLQWCWCCGLSCTCRNSPPLQPLKEAERFKKQMLPELLVMSRL